MKKLAIALAVSAIALSATPASAAKWMGQNFDQPYFSVKGGVNSVQDDNGYNFDTGYNVNAAIGYSAATNVRAELEVGFSAADADGDAEVNTATIMANGYYDFTCLNWMVTPYLGAGIGAAHQRLDGSNNGWEFAYQGMAGASYSFSPTLAVTAEYRYTGTTDISDTSYDSHNFLAGLKFAY